MIKYLNPSLKIIGQGPQTSEWTSWKGDEARLLTLAIQGKQWCLANWHKSHSKFDNDCNWEHNVTKINMEGCPDRQWNFKKIWATRTYEWPGYRLV